MHITHWLVYLFRRLLLARPSSWGNSDTRLLNHFQRKPDVRIQLLEDIANGQAQPSTALSPLELVAVLSLHWRKPIDDQVQRMTYLSRQSWSSHFTEEFFSALDETIREFYIKGFDQEAKSLLKFAEAAARNRGTREWEVRFHKEIDKRIVDRIRRMPLH